MNIKYENHRIRYIEMFTSHKDLFACIILFSNLKSYLDQFVPLIYLQMREIAFAIDIIQA